MAKIAVPPDYDLAAIAEAAGQPDRYKRSYAAGELYVEGVSQSSLDVAVANYSDLARLKRSKRQELLIAFKAEWEVLWTLDGIYLPQWIEKIEIKRHRNIALTANETSKIVAAQDLFDKLETKFADVNNATTEAQVQAVVW